MSAALPAAEQVLRRDQARREAMLRADLDALLGLLDEHMVYIHASGLADDRDSFLHSLRTGALRYISLVPAGMRPLPLGADAMLITGRIQTSIFRDGQPKELDSRFTSAWVQRDRAWRMLSWQSTQSRAPG